MREKRRNEIIQMIKRDKMIKVTDLLEKYHVSGETIRRDLEYLEKQGVLERTHGGAVAKTMYYVEPEYDDRKIKNYEQKQAIAQTAVTMIKDGDAIIIDVGTTTFEMAKLLIHNKKVTVFTNALKIASLLSADNAINVILLGGNVRLGEISTSGFLAEEALCHFYIDKAFLGVGGITAEQGITDYHIEESHIRQLYVSRSREIIALADYSKFGITALNHVCNIDEINTLITDKKANQSILKQIKQKNCNIIIAN